MPETLNLEIGPVTAFRLSSQQERAFTLAERRGTVQSSASVLLTGPVSPSLLRDALREVVARNEILRTVFRRQPGMKTPFQVITDEAEVGWQELDRSRPPQAERTVASLEQGPVLEADFIAHGPDRRVLVLRLPFLCSDSRGMQNLVTEIGRAYAAKVSGAEPDEGAAQYADIVEWQNQLLELEEAQAGREFWRESCRQIDFASWRARALPFLKKDPVTTFVPDRVAALAAEAPGEDELLACWMLFLSRITGRSDAAVNCLCDGREHEELSSALGLLAKDLPVGFQIDPEMSFGRLASRVAEHMTQVREWQQCFDWRGAQFDDPLPLAFEYGVYEEGEIHGGVTFTLQRIETTGEPHTLKLSARRQGGTLTLDFEYDAGQLDRTVVERWSGEFQTLLTAALANPDEPVSRLPLLPESARQQILIDWNRTEAPYPETRCFHELFEEQAALTPDLSAVRCAGRQLSYRELNEEANQLAHRLRDMGVGPDSRVGLCLERSVELLVGVLAIHKAGGAYAAVQPDHPAARLAHQLQGTAAVLTESKLASALPQTSAPVICLDTDRALWQTLPRANPAQSARPENLAYVIYTSGSTGTPKGVLVRHRNLVNYAWFIRQLFQLDRQTPPWQCASVSTLSADLGNTCIYPALLAGGCVHLIEPEMASDPRALGKYFAEQGVDVLKIVPSHLRALLDAGGGRDMLPRRRLILGGEPLSRALAERIEALGAGCEIVNHYGPTETTVGSLLLRLGQYDWRAGEAAGIPIGRPIANTRAYILDAQQQPLPIGIAGELCLGGAGVTAGYLEQPEETAARFLPDPFQPGERLYRTGDRARYLADGQVEFLGRLDEQIKIRGYRVEPGEAEAAISRHPGVRQAAVLACAGQDGEKQLAAYAVARPEAGLTVEELRRHLKAALPDYLVPAVLVLLPKLPLTANGKLDRQALPAFEAAAAQTQVYEPPQTPVEQSLADIWTELLRRERIGRRENFFDIGGHSLLATQVVSRIRRAFDADLPLRTLFESPTVAGLAREIEALRSEPCAAADPGIVPVSRDRVLPLSYAQQRLWVLDRIEPGNPMYNICRGWRMKGKLNAAALRQALNGIVQRHESQRTTFTTRFGQPVQVVAPRLEIEIAVEDLTFLLPSEREPEALGMAVEASRETFNLEKGPLLRARLFTLGAEEHILLLTMHHIVSDAWSAGVFFRELTTLYDAFSGGTPAGLPELSIQYADYAVWQRNRLAGEVLRKEIGYWEQQLRGTPAVIDLPFDRPRPAVQSFEGAHRTFVLPAALSTALNRLSRAAGTTLFMTLLGGFSVLLNRLSDAEQLVIGTDAANRPTAETEQLIGFFINLLPLHIDVSGNPSFEELLKRVKEVTLGAYAHQDLPFDKLVEHLQPERVSSHSPIVQTLFVMQNVPRAPRQLPGLEVSAFEIPVTHSKFDLAVFAAETPSGIVAHWLYKTALFDRQTIERMAGGFEAVLDAAVSQSSRRIGTFPLLKSEDQAQRESERKKRREVQFSRLKSLTPEAVDLPLGE